MRLQPLDANNFKLKPSLISIVHQHQFVGHSLEDLNGHVAYFLELAHTIKVNEVPHDVIKISLFLFLLKDKARSWYQCFTQGSIKTWKNLVEAFLKKLFPPPLTSHLRVEISHFRQGEFQTLFNA